MANRLLHIAHSDPMREERIYQAHPEFPMIPVVPQDVTVIQRM
jgi:hypothetical protein